MIPITIPMAIHMLILTINHTRLDLDTTITAKEEVMDIIITTITEARIVVPVSRECAVLAVYFKCVFADHSIHTCLTLYYQTTTIKLLPIFPVRVRGIELSHKI
jgi:hypothetical protein